LTDLFICYNADIAGDLKLPASLKTLMICDGAIINGNLTHPVENLQIANHTYTEDEKSKWEFPVSLSELLKLQQK
jgi:hypothetical protein